MPDEPNLGGSFRFTGQGGRFSRAFRGGAASASLKFDIPGLQQFRREIDDIRSSLDRLRASFTALAKSPEQFAKQLKAVNDQLRQLRQNMPAGQQGGFGTPPNFIPTGQTGMGGFSNMLSSLGMGRGGPPGGTGSFGGLPGGGGGGGGALPSLMIATAVGDAVKKLFQAAGAGVTAMGTRFDAGASTAAQMDVFGARTAMYTGTPMKKAYSQLGQSGMPFFGNAVEVQAEMYRQGTFGNVLGGPGITGQRGFAAATSIQQMQYLMPGMTAQQAGGVVSGMQQNVAGQRMGAVVFGQAASMYKRGGGMKTMSEYFAGVLKSLQTQARTGDRAGQPFTKEELMGLRIPGSNLYSWLAQLQWDQDTINAFFDWAIGQASTDPTMKKIFEPTEKGMTELRGGKSLATERQKVEETEATRATGFAGRQYDAMIKQAERDQQMIAVLTALDKTLSKFYDLLGQGPTGTGGLVGQGIGKLGKIAGGAALGGVAAALAPETFGLSIPAAMVLGGVLGMGDPGPQTSGLNPDLKQRVDAMRAANPNIQVVSGLRTSMQQKRLWDTKAGNVAPPGKSQHTRGNAADLGPVSQYGWIAKNARRFGLDHAGHLGEPWHVQRSGTISGVGDPPPPSGGGDWAADAVSRQVGYSRAYALAEAQGALSGGTGAASKPSAASATSAAAASAGPTEGKVELKTVIDALYKAGFRDEDLVAMGAIPERESKYVANAHNPNRATGDNSYGLWQINVLPQANYSTAKDFLGSENWEELFDPYKSAQLAYIMYQRSGNTLRPWGGYKGKTNTYDVPQSALDAARATARELGYIGDPYSGLAAPPMGGNGGSQITNLSNTPVVFNNNFHITTTPGTDTEALARSLSGRLEVQFRRAAGTRR